MKKEKTLEDTMNFVRKVADHRGWKLVSQAEQREEVIEGLSANVNRLGYYLCPCRDTEGVRERDRDITCPCDYAQTDIDEYGQCFCGLYVSPGFDQEGREIESIPERRPEELEDY